MTKKSDASLVRLLKGVEKFGKEVYPHEEDLFRKLANAQSPHTLFITCGDSRVDPNLITQSSPGELFIIRNVGNIVPQVDVKDPNITAALHYAVEVMKVKNIIICGHSNCGAMKALEQFDETGKWPASDLADWLKYAEAALEKVKKTSFEKSEHVCCNLTEANVRLQISHLKTYSFIQEAKKKRNINIKGWYYNIGTGTVSVVQDSDTPPLLASEELALLKKRRN
ncbi:carbonic anhydrase [Acetobacteraceae bacterium]|nr:carbonic anhydrase [Acetobacteraceae bacterium]